MNHHQRKRCGFTLTELAIVLGIIGLILGAIWVAAAKVYQNNRVQTAVKEMQTILQGYRSLYTTHQVDSGDWTDITCLGVNSGFFPTDMVLPNTTCATGATYTYPKSPWPNSYVYVQSVQTWQGIAILFANLNQQACNQLAQQVASVPDVIFENVGGTTVSIAPPAGSGTPFTQSQISSYCLNNSTNLVALVFRAK